MSNPFLDIIKRGKYPAPKKGAMEFPVGENLSPEQTKKAVQKVKEPDYRAEERYAKSPIGFTKNVIEGIPKTAGNVFKEILQSTARTVGTVGITAGNIPKRMSNATHFGDQVELLPSEIPTDQTKVGRILFGGKPIRDIPNAGANAARTIDALRSTVKGGEVKPTSSKFNVPLGIAGSLIDLTGFGGKAGLKAFTAGEIPEQFLKYAAREKSATALEDTLKGIGLDDINAKSLSLELAPTKRIDEVKDVLLKYSSKEAKPAENTFKNILKGDVQPQSDIVGKVMTVEKGAFKDVPVTDSAGNPVNTAPSNPLIEEVKKYKTTINIQNKEDIAQLRRILSDDAIADIKNGKMTNWQGKPYEDLAKVNIKSFVPKTTEQELVGRIKPYTLKSNEMFHGTSPETAVKIQTEGFKVGSALGDDAFRGGGYDAKQNSISFSTDPMIASNFTGTGSRGALIKTTIKPNAKVVTIDGIDYAEDLNKYVKDLRKQGIDAVYLEGEKEIVIINKAVIDKISDVKEFDVFNKKSQLTDIYNQAQESQKIMSSENIENGLTPAQADVIRGTLSQVDKLIAENKIRVVSRNGRDVYQVKKGKQWMNTRDEESAVRQATKVRQPVKQPEMPEEIQKKEMEVDQLSMEISVIEETIDQLPGKMLKKFVSKKEGQFVDPKRIEKDQIYTQKDANQYKRNKEIMRVAETAFEGTAQFDQFSDVDVIRNAIDEYNTTKENLAKLKIERAKAKQELLKEKMAVKDEKVLNKIADKEMKKVEKERPTPLVEQKPVQKIDTTTGSGRSLEILSQQALDRVPEPFQGEVSSLPKIIIDTATNVKQKINLLDYLRTPDRVLRKIGFGKEAELLRTAYDEYLKELPKNIQKITDWADSLPKESAKRIFQYLDGEAIDLSVKEKEVATEIKDWLAQWARRLGLEKDNTISHYITHIFEKDFIQKEFDEDLAKIISEKLPGQVYDPFLEKRLGKKGYIQDVWRALDAYTKRATRKVHMDPALEAIQSRAGSSLEFANVEESQWKYLKNYINNVNMRPTWLDNMADNTIKSVIGYKGGQRPFTSVLRFFRQMTFRGMLGLNLSSAMRNLSQGVNTYAKLGEKYTVIGYAKLFQTGAVKELEEQGVLNAGFISDRNLSSTRQAIQKFDKVLFTLFETAEKINRGSAYFGAKSKAIAKGMSEEQAIVYAKKLVRDTQFTFGSVDTPVALQNDIAKTLLQFQNFSIKQTEFLTEMAKNKEYAGIIRYMLAGLAFVYAIGSTFGMENDELVPFLSNITRGKSPFGNAPSLRFPKELASVAINAPDKYGRTRDMKQKAKDVGNSLIGLFPAGSQIKKTFQGIQSIDQGGSFTKDGKLQFTQDMSTTGKIKAIFFGKYASDEAQNYFDKSQDTSKELKQIKPVYEEVQKLLKEDPESPEAQSIVEGLSDTQYELYKKYKTAEKTKETLQGKKDILPKYLEVQQALKDNPDKAQKLVEDMTEDEYKYYELVKKQVERDAKAADGKTPLYGDGEAQTEQGVIGTVVTYAKAIGTNPVTAFNRIFTGQKIRRVDGGAIIVQRMSLKDSEKVKKDRGTTGNMKLDHILPLQLGGSNSEDNLSLIDNDVWASYTPVENYLGQKLRSKEISSKVAQDLILRFKHGEITADDVYNYK